MINAATKHAYTGKNIQSLADHMKALELTSIEWAGFKQWESLGYKVKKGSKGAKIFFHCEKKMGAKNAETGEDVKSQVFKGAYVFNRDQVEKIEG